jgi:endonuclease/exonuclease/phosphatase family metal-dependent hydrolase
LAENSSFVIMGDMNADPVAGDSYKQAALLLCEHPLINLDASTGKLVPQSLGSIELHKKRPNGSRPESKTADFGLRIDYVLPSADLKVLGTGVFWPPSTSDLSHLTERDKGSDHRLVWADILIK